MIKQLYSMFSDSLHILGKSMWNSEIMVSAMGSQRRDIYSKLGIQNKKSFPEIVTED